LVRGDGNASISKRVVQAAVDVVTNDSGGSKAVTGWDAAADNNFPVRLNGDGRGCSGVGALKYVPEISGYDAPCAKGWIELASLCGGWCGSDEQDRENQQPSAVQWGAGVHGDSSLLN
jgi:hypothetical protein